MEGGGGGGGGGGQGVKKSVKKDGKQEKGGKNFCNDDGDGNGNVKKAIGLAKQQVCTCITLFSTFLYRPLKTAT